MKKIPTLFLRQRDGQPRCVVDEVNPGCEWVLGGEGVPTAKVDGTCCRMLNGRLYRRREVKRGQGVPEGFEEVDADPVTGKRFGWVEIGDGPEDRWHREAFDESLPDGTYELVGPKVQGNPEDAPEHRLVPHGRGLLPDVVQRDFSSIREFLEARDIEGIVWHHPDGRMVKIKKKDFGMRRRPSTKGR